MVKPIITEDGELIGEITEPPYHPPPLVTPPLIDGPPIEKVGDLPGKKGNSYGNANLGVISKIRKVLFDDIEEEDWSKIRQTLVRKCIDGDTKAINILLSFTLGKNVNMTVNTPVTHQEAMKHVNQFFGIEEYHPPVTGEKIDEPKEPT